MMNTKTKAWINLVVLVATLIVNGLGGTGLINNSSQSDVSREYQTLITPAGFAFSIWSLIYGLLFFAVVVMIVKRNDPYYNRAIESISPLFWLSSAFNMGWIVTFSYYQIGISAILIFGYLFSLTFIVKKLLNIHENKRWLLPLAFGLNTGWLFIASVVNVSTYLVQIEWDGFGISDVTWTAIMLVVSVILALLVLLNLKNAAFPLPIAWAYFAINRELASIDESFLLQMIALGGMVVLAAAAVWIFQQNKTALYPERQTV